MYLGALFDREDNKNMKVSLILVLVGLLGVCSGANILVLLPLPLLSHTNSYMPLIEELAIKGHAVTLYSPFEPKKPIKNLKHVAVQNLWPNGPPNITNFLKKDRTLSFLQPFRLWYMGHDMTKDMLKMPPLVELAKDKTSKFDLIMSETFFIQEVLVGFGHKFSAPVVNLYPGAPGGWVSYMTGSPNPYSYVPDLKGTFTDRMTFQERISNTISNMFEIFFGRYYYLSRQETAMKEFFQDETMPGLLEMLMKTPLTLIDSHFTMTYQRPYHNNIVEIGGLSIQTNKHELPKEIETFMNGAKDGVIYFTTGSWLKTSDLGPEAVAAFLEAFASLKQRVLWKWNAPPLENKPKNVLTAPWFPQNTILAHKKLLCFVTHGGAHGLYEAMYHGVPVVAMPVVAEQPYNVRFMEEIGAGVHLSLSNITAGNIIRAINTVISDPKYKENAVIRGKMLMDRPVPVLENAVYWVEYILKYKGAAHIRPAALDISWCRYLLLDVVGVFLLVASLGIYIPFAVCRFICCRCCSKKTASKTAKNLSKTKKTQ